MKLVFLTQVVDSGDAVLGFVSRWLQGLARHCEEVRVIALELGDTSDLPHNVSLRAVGRQGRLLRYLRYKRHLAEALRDEGFDAVLAHMVPRYSLLAARPARRAGAGSFLWYTHATVDARLRRALRQVDKVFTASPESLRVETPKRVVTGHGIDLEHFRSPGPGSALGIDAPLGRAARPRLLAVGRLTPRKDPLTILAAMAILVARGHDLELDLVGAGLTDQDLAYERSVREQIEVGGISERVTLLGAVPYREIPAYYQRSICLVSASLTGSLDKVLLEAMAAGTPFVSCNDAGPGLVSELGPERFSFAAGDADQLAQRIEGWLATPLEERRALGQRLRALVARDHEVDSLMERLVREMEAARGA